MLYCPNYTCQALNPETHRFCQTCKTPLPKRYLWAVGDHADAFQPGELVVNRYLCKRSRIFLDTRPGFYPLASSESLPDSLLPYLRTSPYQLHVPQIYDLLFEGPSDAPTHVIALLERSPLYCSSATAGFAQGITPGSPSAATEVALLPAIGDQWAQASARRQLYWLWQIAQLWHPLALEHVALSLLTPELLRVEGSLVRLLELRLEDPGSEPTLANLGQLWAQWATRAHPDIALSLNTLCQRLIQDQIQSIDIVIDQLDAELAQADRGQRRRIDIATLTDQGPSRSRNEDACFPPSGTLDTQLIEDAATVQAAASLVVVCDGIGGHQGGDVASNLAIAAVQQQVQPLPLDRLPPLSLMQELEGATCLANDLISQRNDAEQRQDRQRMGTTLVMGLIRHHELYLTHIGDSRAYWITRWGCHQVTLDDDVASREVRLGYSYYREALQHPSSGSLVQALGMNSSAMLRPTVQRFILDEDSVFLLCSDGLSDSDRVEDYWDLEILPVLEGKTDLATAIERLMAIANTCNGHDNTTIGLIYCQLLNPTPPQGQSLSSPQQADLPTVLAAPGADRRAAAKDQESLIAANPSSLKTKLAVPSSAETVRAFRPVALLVMLGLAAGLAALLTPFVAQWLEAQGLLDGGSTPPPSATPSPTPTDEPPALQAGALIQIGRPTAPNSPPLRLFAQPPAESGAATSDQVPVGAVPAGSVLQILAIQPEALSNRWLNLQVCSVGTDDISASPAGAIAPVSPRAAAPTSTPTATTPAIAVVQPGDRGWVSVDQVLPLAMSNPTLRPEQRGVCGAPLVPSTTPSPSATPPLPTDSPSPTPLGQSNDLRSG